MLIILLQKIRRRLLLYKERIRIFRIHLIHLIKYGYYSFSIERYNVYPEKKLCYIDIPKAASTSIKKLMIDVMGYDLEGYDIQNFHSRKFAKNHFINNGDYFSFSFTRNPYERLVSCYQNKVIDEAHLPFNSFNTYLFGYLKQASSFSDFIERVCRIPSSIQEGHIRNQYDIIYDEQHQCRAHFIGKYENIEDDWKTIQQRYHLPNLSILNKTKKKDWRDFYTLESAQQVYHKYKKDIHTFNYLQEYENLITYLKSKK